MKTNWRKRKTDVINSHFSNTENVENYRKPRINTGSDPDEQHQLQKTLKFNFTGRQEKKKPTNAVRERAWHRNRVLRHRAENKRQKLTAIRRRTKCAKRNRSAKQASKTMHSVFGLIGVHV